MIILSAGRAEEKSELTAQKLGASVHSPTLLYPRPQGAFFFFTFERKRALATSFAPQFLLSLFFRCLFSASLRKQGIHYIS